MTPAPALLPEHRTDGGNAVEALFESLTAALERGDRVVIRRFGRFHAAPRKTGDARDPRTGAPAGFPRGQVGRFRRDGSTQSPRQQLTERASRGRRPNEGPFPDGPSMAR